MAEVLAAEVLAEVLGVVVNHFGHALVLLVPQTPHVHQALAAVVFVVQAHPHSLTVKRVQCRLDHALRTPLVKHVFLLLTVQPIYVSVVAAVQRRQ